MELDAQFEHHADALLRDNTPESQSDIRTEAVHPQAARDISVLVDRNGIIADDDTRISRQIGQRVTVSADLYNRTSTKISPRSNEKRTLERIHIQEHFA